MGPRRPCEPSPRRAPEAPHYPQRRARTNCNAHSATGTAQATLRYALFACAGFCESRSSRRRILPTFDFGSSSRNSMYFGFL